MSYEKQTWTTGDTITANKLNHMEDGIAEGGSSAFDLFFMIDEASDTTYAKGLSIEQLYQKAISFGNLNCAYMEKSSASHINVDVFHIFQVQQYEESDSTVTIVGFTGVDGGIELTAGMGEYILTDTVDTKSYTFSYNESTGIYTLTLITS